MLGTYALDSSGGGQDYRYLDFISLMHLLCRFLRLTVPKVTVLPREERPEVIVPQVHMTPTPDRT